MSTLPTGRELERLRATLAASTSSTAAFERRGTGQNTRAGRDMTPVAVPDMDAVPCHIHPDTQRSASETEQASGALGVDERFRIMFPIGTDARTSDIVSIDGEVYEVVTTDTGRSTALEVEVLAVRSS